MCNTSTTITIIRITYAFALSLAYLLCTGDDLGYDLGYDLTPSRYMSRAIMKIVERGIEEELGPDAFEVFERR